MKLPKKPASLQSPNPPDNASVYIQERMRQARQYSNWALITTVCSAGLSLVGSGLLLAGKISEGIAINASAAMAGVPCVHCHNLAKDANDRLDRLVDFKTDTPNLD